MNKKIILGIFAILLISLTAGKSYIIQDSSGNPILVANGSDNNVGIGLNNPDSALDVSGNLDLNNNNISNFFASGCSPNQAVTGVYSNGSYKCTDVITEGLDVENLSATLEEGSIANQSIFMSDNNISNPGFVDTVDLDNPSIGISLSSNRYRIAANSIDNGLIVDNNITNSSIDSFSSFTLQDLDVTNDLTGTGIVGSTQIASGAVTNTELGSGSVNNDSISSFNSFTLQDLELTNSLTGTGIVGTAQLASNSVTSGKISTGAVGNSEIANNVVNRTQLDGSDCTGNQVLRSDGSDFNCVDQANIGSDDQNLSEVLEQGNVANQSINMSDNRIQNVISTSAGDAVNRSWVNDNDDTADNDNDATNELQNLSEVLTEGSIANQSINMSSSSIEQVADLSLTDGDLKVTRSNSGSNVSATIENTGSNDADAYQMIKSSATGESEVRYFHDGTQYWRTQVGDATSNDYNIETGGNTPALTLYYSTQDVELPNGDLLAQSGANNDPSIAFSGDTDTGIYNSAADSLAVTTGATQAININSSQDVSIANGDLYLNGNNLSDVGGLTGCTADQALLGDGSCGTSGSDDQDLQYSPGTLPTSENYAQEIGIENGANITFNDTYEPDDQALSMSGDQLSLDNGGSLFVTFANNSDTLDNYEAAYLNTTISSISNSDQTQTITLSNGDTASWTDNVDDADASTTNEIQGFPSVLEQNSTANQSIDMNNNNINDIGQLNSNSQELKVGGDINATGNNVEDVSRVDLESGDSVTGPAGGDMCLGDRC